LNKKIHRKGGGGELQAEKSSQKGGKRVIGPYPTNGSEGFPSSTKESGRQKRRGDISRKTISKRVKEESHRRGWGGRN